MAIRRTSFQRGIIKLSQKLQKKLPYEARGPHRKGVDEDNFQRQKRILRRHILENLTRKVDPADRQTFVELARSMLSHRDQKITEKELKLIHTLGKEKITDLMEIVSKEVIPYKMNMTVDEHTVIWAFTDIQGVLFRMWDVFSPPRRAH